MQCELCQELGSFYPDPGSDDLVYCSCRKGKMIRLVDRVAIFGFFVVLSVGAVMFVGWLRSK